MVKKLKLIIITITLLPAVALAQIQDFTDQAAEQAGFNTDPNLAQTGIAQVVGTVANVFISLLGVIFISYIIYGGWVWMTASGDEEKITKAKKTIRQGIIGLVIVLSAAGIYLFIKEGLGLFGDGSDFIPGGS
jgi:amino acid transporter